MPRCTCLFFLLESHALRRAVDPSLSAVQGAALRELMISVALLVILRSTLSSLAGTVLNPALPVAAAATATPRHEHTNPIPRETMRPPSAS